LKEVTMDPNNRVSDLVERFSTDRDRDDEVEYDNVDKRYEENRLEEEI